MRGHKKAQSRSKCQNGILPSTEIAKAAIADILIIVQAESTCGTELVFKSKAKEPGNELQYNDG